ncbi:NAD(P)-dependent glycerol-1-phosphate dehydrogenase [Halosegnis longus]|uniref:Glycerol-1-phosphate dehydrogenase [NAD(P)+] n=1 Tax=Halosegnis longus TaxID=2216012 RepID=A0AAJ4RA71_9EURY|nr:MULTISPECIES: NAD(P)-dependent glycerol-1-phosphate dehydrogenase [Halobacteriales]RNJ27011.1 NAD(P)-dependent glycerol-1-phosphate dehydrogenase [Salella cibi]
MFEKSTWIKLPRSVIVGHGTIDRVPEAVADLHLAGRPLVVTSPTPDDIAGDRLRDGLAGVGPAAETVVAKEARFETVERVIETARAEEAGYLVGLGGGKPIDIAKMAADELDVGFVSVPTTASHDGIVSGRGSVPEGDTRHSVAADPPLAVIADTELIANAPWRLTTAGCADIISNYTAVKDWQLANRLKNVEYSEYAGELSQLTAEMLVSRADSVKRELEESAWLVTKALVSSGVAMSIADSSRPASGAEHLISHQLDRLAPDAALHGHQVGVASIVTEYLHSGNDGEWTQVRDALASIDAPVTTDELDIDGETFIEAVTSAHEIRDRYTILGDGMSEGAAIEAATVTGVL